MTIEELAVLVGAPNTIALQNKLNEFSITVEDCQNNLQYQADLKSEFSTGLAVVENSIVATTPDNQSKVAAPVPEKKKGGRMTKAQKIEQQQAAAQSAAANGLSFISAETDRQIANTRQQIEAIDDLTSGLATYVGGEILAIESTIALKIGAIVAESGDDCRVGLAGITRRVVDDALSQFV